jgi:hypothetical protein
MKFFREHFLRTVTILLLANAPFSVALAAEIDSGIREMKRGQEKGDYEQILDGLETIAYRFKDLLAKQNKTAGRINAAGEEILKAMKVYNQDPMILEDITDAINKDADAIEAKRPPSYEVENPITEGLQTKLANSAPSDRKGALNEIRNSIITQKDHLRTKLAETEKVKADATSMVGIAEAAEKRGLDIEKTLEQAFESPAGGILTTASSKFGFIFLDMVIHVNPALAGRTNAVNHYLKRCNAQISALQNKIEELDRFESWVGYYQWELGMKFPSSEFERSIALLEDLERLQGKRTDQRSAEARRIEKLVDATMRETKATKERAENLVKYAQFKDENAARIEAFANLYNLGASVSSLGAGNSKDSKAVSPSTKNILDEFEQIAKQKPTILRANPTNTPPVTTSKNPRLP